MKPSGSKLAKVLADARASDTYRRETEKLNQSALRNTPGCEARPPAAPAAESCCTLHNKTGSHHNRWCSTVSASAPSATACRGFLPGADPRRCAWCGVTIEEHPITPGNGTTPTTLPGSADSSGKPGTEARHCHPYHLNYNQALERVAELERELAEARAGVLQRLHMLGALIAEVSKQAPPALAVAIFSAAKVSPSTTRTPDGYAAVMADGWFVGIWKDRETAELVANKHPKGEVRPVLFTADSGVKP